MVVGKQLLGKVLDLPHWGEEESHGPSGGRGGRRLVAASHSPATGTQGAEGKQAQ